MPCWGPVPWVSLGQLAGVYAGHIADGAVGLIDALLAPGEDGASPFPSTNRVLPRMRGILVELAPFAAGVSPFLVEGSEAWKERRRQFLTSRLFPFTSTGSTIQSVFLRIATLPTWSHRLKTTRRCWPEHMARTPKTFKIRPRMALASLYAPITLFKTARLALRDRLTNTNRGTANSKAECLPRFYLILLNPSP